jgi:hypothetical protein
MNLDAQMKWPPSLAAQRIICAGAILAGRESYAGRLEFCKRDPHRRTVRSISSGPSPVGARVKSKDPERCRSGSCWFELGVLVSTALFLPRRPTDS